MKPLQNRPLTLQRLREVMRYDPGTGAFTWLIKTRYKKPGDSARVRQKNGFTARIDGEVYKTNRLAWLYMMGVWPDDLIDHKNRDSHDDRWENLRPATYEQNGCNRAVLRNNTSGYTGVVYVKRRKKWAAQIRINGKNRELGVYGTPVEAYEVYAAKARELRGEFASV